MIFYYIYCAITLKTLNTTYLDKKLWEIAILIQWYEMRMYLLLIESFYPSFNI